MIDTIIFDLDGTLLNTLEDLTDSTNYALAEFNLPMRTIKEVRHFVGNGVELLIKRAVEGRLGKKKKKSVLLYLRNIIQKICIIKPDRMTE